MLTLGLNDDGVYKSYRRTFGRSHRVPTRCGWERVNLVCAVQARNFGADEEGDTIVILLYIKTPLHPRSRCLGWLQHAGIVVRTSVK
jgi:hypothetical protein